MAEFAFDITGVWDLHIHPSPDLIPRIQTVEDVLADAEAAGMSGVVVKSHLGCTANDCAGVSGRYSPRALSSITLNTSAGGFSPSSIEDSAVKGSRVVWFPTVSARNHIEIWGESEVYPKTKDGGLSVFEASGRLSSEVEACLEVIAMKDMVMCSGHLAPAESLALFRRAKELGIERMVLTHASEEVTRASLEIQESCKELGVFIEHCLMGATPCCPGFIALEQLATEIRESGIDSVILTSDFGQIENGPIVEGFASYLSRLRDLGFTEEDLHIMVRENPEHLIS